MITSARLPGAGITRSPTLRRTGDGGDGGLVLAVDQDQLAMAATARSWHHLGEPAVTVEGGVGDRQHPVLDHR